MASPAGPTPSPSAPSLHAEHQQLREAITIEDFRRIREEHRQRPSPLRGDCYDVKMLVDHAGRDPVVGVRHLRVPESLVRSRDGNLGCRLRPFHATVDDSVDYRTEPYASPLATLVVPLDRIA